MDITPAIEMPGVWPSPVKEDPLGRPIQDKHVQIILLKEDVYLYRHYHYKLHWSYCMVEKAFMASLSQAAKDAYVLTAKSWSLVFGPIWTESFPINLFLMYTPMPTSYELKMSLFQCIASCIVDRDVVTGIYEPADYDTSHKHHSLYIFTASKRDKERFVL